MRGSRPAELDPGQLIPELPLPARILLLCRGLRGLADGAVSVLLAGYLVHLGFTPVEVGALVTATLLGSALLTIAVGVSGGSLPPRSILLAAAGLMLATGVAFAGLRSFWPLMLVAFVGTLNPSSGDVSVFLPTEQAALAHLGHPREATARFAWYNVLGTLSGAAGALVGAGLVAGATRLGLEPMAGERWGFVLYALVAVAVWVLYRSLPRWGESTDRPPRVLHRFAQARPAALRPVQPGLVRRRIRRSIPPRPLAGTPLRLLGGSQRTSVLRHRPLCRRSPSWSRRCSPGASATSGPCRTPTCRRTCS